MEPQEDIEKKKLFKYIRRVKPDELVEDGYLSNIQLSKIKVIEGASFLLNSIIISFSVSYVKIPILNKKYEMNYERAWENEQNLLLVSTHCCSFLLSFVIIYKYYMRIKLLKIKQQIRSHDGIYSTNNLKPLLIEIFISLLHPNILLHGIDYNLTKDITFSSYNSLTNTYTSHFWNDILIVMSLFRMGYVMNSIIAMSANYSNRTMRLCMIQGFQLDFTFLIKSLVNNSPFFTISFVGAISIFLFAYAIRVCERPLTEILGDQNYGHLTGALWNTVVTMTTVGYGDMFPRTLPGRVLIFFLCVWGIFMVSLMVVTLTNMVSLGRLESKGMNLYLRLEAKDNLQYTAARIIQNLFMLRKEIKGFTYGKKRNGYSILKKLLRLVRTFRKLKRTVDKFEDAGYSEDDMITILDHLHFDLKILKRNQKKIVKTNQKLIRSMEEYALVRYRKRL